MTKTGAILAGIIIIAISLAGCKNDNAELLYPPDVCDTSNVTYNNSILPILRNNCYSCHAGNATIAPFRLDSYADVSTYAANGQLWGSVAHSPGYVPMPENANQLSSCDLAKIRKWIDEGYPNN